MQMEVPSAVVAASPQISVGFEAARGRNTRSIPASAIAQKRSSDPYLYSAILPDCVPLKLIVAFSNGLMHRRSVRPPANLLTRLRRWFRPAPGDRSTELIDEAIESAKANGITDVREAANSYYGFSLADEQWNIVQSRWQKRWY
ncbi:hypothetical protein ACU5AX_09195 [Sphingomonas sp. XXL09]|uniref:hypothetical protein n=1 Tax=Sphingomonas sp. XXL09 TaxID=3457787 RepID=UPI00406BC44C